MRTILRKHWFAIFGIIILCGISFGAGWWSHAVVASSGERLLAAAYRNISGESIFNAQTDEALSDAAIRGMLATIPDPYAELIEPDAAGNFTNTFHGQTGVVGLYATNQAGRVVLTIVYPGGAASAAGIRVGDVLLAIDGHALSAAADSSEVGLLLRGTPGTTVNLSVERDGVAFEYELVRKQQVFTTARMLPGQIGYIALYAYNQTAAQQFQQELKNLMQQNPAGIVWDLRNNEGGDMQAAQAILSNFVRDGPLFTAQLTHDRQVEFRAGGQPVAGDVPLVVLTDHTTYSAAETSAAAIAETGRGTTVGETTYGKGVIQATISLPENHLLQLTVAKWLSPKGAWYHGRGVTPQVAAHDDADTSEDEILAKGIGIFK